MKNRYELKGKKITAAVLAFAFSCCSLNAENSVFAEKAEDKTAESVISYLSGSGMRGDCNGDGVINVMDLRMYKNCILNVKEFDPESNLYRLDVNADGAVSAADILTVQNEILGRSRIWSYQSVPKMDGSTSAVPLEAGFKSKMLGISYSDARLIVSHHKTHESFSMLLSGENDMIFTVPISDSQKKEAEEAGVKLNFVPVAKEGFVFVVNKNNPVDSLTQQQIKDIYSGKITNWKEVGGKDEEIVPYQRNNDSGSQNYMTEFMNDSKLMDPPKSHVLGSMSALMDGLAFYDNAENALGYSVYSYAAQMYENSSDVKFIAVDGIKPSRETMSDGTYPLLSCTYILYTDEASRNTLDFAEWAVSDEGQKCVLESGYVPVRDMEYPDELKPYQEKGTGAEKPADYRPSKKYSTFWDYSSHNNREGEYRISFLRDKEFENEINQNIAEICSKYPSCEISTTIINGYMNINFETGSEDVSETPAFYAPVYSAVVNLNYDLKNKKKIEKFSDLFYKGEDFIQEVNKNTGNHISMFYSKLLKTDFLGLLGNPDNFSFEKIYLDKSGPYMTETVQINFSSDYLTDSLVYGEYFDCNQILADEYSCHEYYYPEWETDILTRDDGTLCDTVTGSRFHTDEEVSVRRKAYEKAEEQYREWYPKQYGNDWIPKRVCMRSPEPYRQDCLNVIYLHPGKVEAYSESIYMADPETGERVLMSDIFGEEFADYGEKVLCTGLDYENGTADLVVFTEDFGEEYQAVSFDKSKVNLKYIKLYEKSLQVYTLSEPLKGTALGEDHKFYNWLTDDPGVYGYEKTFVLDYGPKKKHWKIEGDWNIVAKSKCFSHGETWYECWDADDGDYYGWIRANDIRFD